MKRLENITLTDISSVLMVESIGGKQHIVENRPQYGLSFCKSGRITYEHNGVHTISDCTNAVILPQGETYTVLREVTGEFPVINFTCTESFELREHLAIPIHNAESYIRDFEQIRKLFLFPSNRMRVFSIMYDMLHRLLSESAKSDEILTPAIRYIENHYTDRNLSNKTLAEQSRISEVYLRQLFSRQVGTSPKQYIINLRLERSKQMLVESNRSVTEIAESCGFSTLAHFCDAFGTSTGQTPSDYRRNNRNIN